MYILPIYKTCNNHFVFAISGLHLPDVEDLHHQGDVVVVIVEAGMRIKHSDNA